MKKDTNNKLDAFGVTQDEVDNMGIFTPTLEFKQMKKGEKAIVQFLEDTPRKIDYEDKETKEKKTFNVIRVKFLKRIEVDGTELDINGTYDMPLSAKTLSMGVAKIAQRFDFKLTDVQAEIRIDTAMFKNYGENRCYRVKEIE